MICAVIKGPKLKDVFLQIEKATVEVDMLEFRFDLFDKKIWNPLKNWLAKKQISLSILFTLRTKNQGGKFEGSDQEYVNAIRFLAAFQPDYIDLESHFPNQLFEEIKYSFQTVKIICSFHDFKGMPTDLNTLYTQLKQKPASLYKIAVLAENTIDAMKLAFWTKQQDGKVIAISMGIYGEFTRILAPVFQSPISYALSEREDETAPGQLLIHDLINLYQYHSLNKETKIYGLIGESIETSLGHEVHNALIKAASLNAVYVKMIVKPKELSSFLKLAKDFPFSGLSVTMPLKEKVIQFLDWIDKEALEMGSVNTLVFEGQKILGYNTDGEGALEVINEYFKEALQGKKIVMIGAGGAAKAIIYKVRENGAEVTILNRNEEKARELGEKFKCRSGGLDRMQECFEEKYDLLINSTPSLLPIDPDFILPSAAIMDVKTVPKVSLLLLEAEIKGAHSIYGYQMFIEQARRQILLWFNRKVSFKEIFKIVQDLLPKDV